MQITGHKDVRKVQILSCPFSAVNPYLFMDYVSSGSISYVDDNNCTLLSDIRYLHGMNAGNACLEDDGSCLKSIGLVIGSLNKRSREGDLTIIVSWSEISQFLQSLPLAYKSRPISLNKNNDVASSGVVLITVTTNNKTVWASGVVVKGKYILTNLHVVGTNKSSYITAWFSPTERTELAIKVVLLVGIDLVILEPKMTLEKYNIPIIKFSCSTPQMRDQVTSIGYGFHYPHSLKESKLKPLYSVGIVSQVISLPVTSKSPSFPVMIVCSAKCWNGSSGGAVFDELSGNKLVGIMASNGKMNDSGEVIPEMAFLIPAQLIEYALSLKSPIKVLKNLERLWKLEQTHLNQLHESNL